MVQKKKGLVNLFKVIQNKVRQIVQGSQHNNQLITQSNNHTYHSYNIFK